MERNTRSVPARQQECPEWAGSSYPLLTGDVEHQFSVLGQVARVDEVDVGIVHWEFREGGPEEGQRNRQNGKANQKQGDPGFGVQSPG